PTGPPTAPSTKSPRCRFRASCNRPSGRRTTCTSRKPRTTCSSNASARAPSKKMDSHRLVHMANQIGSFFQREPDHALALEGIAGHLKRFWEPRMRKQILTWLDEHNGEGLTDLVAEALRTNRQKLAA